MEHLDERIWYNARRLYVKLYSHSKWYIEIRQRGITPGDCMLSYILIVNATTWYKARQLYAKLYSHSKLNIELRQHGIRHGNCMLSYILIVN
jgi:hypothetical protein